METAEEVNDRVASSYIYARESQAKERETFERLKQKFAK